MFGYIICNKKSLSQKEKERYQGVYCGLCRAIGKRFGLLERLSLSYDMAFLALFLSALYEPQEKEIPFTCALHPLHKKKGVENPYIDYAADMTIVMSYYKCQDDWEDERKYLGKKYGDLLEKSFQSVHAKYPRQCEAISKGINELREIEKKRPAKTDEAVNCFGKMLGEIFVYKEDFWRNTLWVFGYELGRFIYLMDASMDYERDIKKGNYNPLLRMQKKPKEMEEIMMEAIGKATEQFEKLPMIQDDHLLRNILYGGVWQHYYVKIHGKEKK